MINIFTRMLIRIQHSFPKELHVQKIMNIIDQFYNRDIVTFNNHNYIYINSINDLKRNLNNLSQINNLILITPNNYVNSFKDIKSNIPIDYHVTSITKFENYLARSIISSNSNNGGVGANDLGDFGEKRVVNALLNQQNIIIWNNFNNNPATSYNFNVFKSILNSNSKLKNLHDQNDPQSKIAKITNVYTGLSNYKNISKCFDQDLAYERGGGKPKTDESATIHLVNGKSLTFNVSVKTPMKSSTRTTVHQGKVSDLIKDLKNSMPKGSIFEDPNMLHKLSVSLTHFQTNGGFNLKKQNCPITQNDLNFLDNNIRSILPWLIKYFCFGINNSRQKNIQIANTLTLFNSTDGHVVSFNSDNVVNELMNQQVSNRKNNPLSSKTPFGWTCPSKVNGKEFQIKANFSKLF